MLNIMDSKIQNLVMDTMTANEMWNYLREFYSEKNNLNRALDIIREMFQIEEGNKTLFQLYVDFSGVY